MKFWKTRPPRFSDFFRMLPSRYYILAGVNMIGAGIITSQCFRLTEAAKKIVAPSLLIAGAITTLKGILDMKRGR